MIKPTSSKHPSNIKDTWDLLDKLRDIEAPSNAIFDAADVQSLYTNIQPNKGYKALRKMYDKYGVSMSFEKINRLFELSLLPNDFLLNYQWLLQTSGAATGKNMHPVLPTYSGLFYRMESH